MKPVKIMIWLPANLDIPSAPGTYALLLELAKPLGVTVGRLGWVTLMPGRYVYLGSAMGLGGLPARIRRHVRPEKTPHWHIDYLTRVTPPAAVHWQPGRVRQECAWCQTLLRQDGVSVPVGHFGSSDCRAGCPAHLLRLLDHLPFAHLLGELI